MFSISVSTATFRSYVSSSSLPIVVYSNHNRLVFLNKLKDNNQPLLRWSLMLQEFVLDIKHIKGMDSVMQVECARP